MKNGHKVMQKHYNSLRDAKWPQRLKAKDEAQRSKKDGVGVTGGVQD